jgi:membrane-bound ClpP family serine protease
MRTLPALAERRGSHVVVYHGVIDQDAPRICYEHLRRVGRVPRLDLVLATGGGSATAARRLALLLHDYTDRLTVLVPHRARSAGTLLCLGAHELVLGPLAELGPLDPQVSSAGAPRPGEPGVISAEDLRAFRRIAEDWFGADREEDRMQLVSLLAQRVFPGSLGAFYRADQLVRQLAGEMLAYQLPEAAEEDRARIVARLVDDYHAHDYAITRAQARELGLRVTHPDAAEEALLWDVASEAIAAREAGPEVLALVAGDGFAARRTDEWRMEE